jgi:hypothetical protein
MGIYSDYINRRLSFQDLTKERKLQLKRIGELRSRPTLVYASDPYKNVPQSIIHQPDLVPFKDQLSYIQGNEIDIVLETPGGIAETVEDLVVYVRSKFQKVGIIIPGSAKSAGTIFTMSGDEILMGSSSSLGPIDAQVPNNGKRFSADAFLDGLEKIKKEISTTGKLNPAYIPMLQTISPGEIQHCENAQNFSKILVTNWLTKYKFKYWSIHKTSGLPVTDEHKEQRAKEIAEKLCKHSDWLTHGRSIRISDLEGMKLKINNYNLNAELSDAIDKYYTILRITFEQTGIYKIFESINSQIYQSVSQSPIQNIDIKPKENDSALADFKCPGCNNLKKIQLNFKKNVITLPGTIKFPTNDIFICPNCGVSTNIAPMRIQLEALTGMKIIND